MKKLIFSTLIIGLIIPLSTLAIVSTSGIGVVKNTTSGNSSGRTVPTELNFLQKKKTTSGERVIPRIRNTLVKTGSGSTGSGTNGLFVNQTNMNAIKEVARPKSRLETAAERQRQREANLAKQKEEEEVSADKQRAHVAASEAKKKKEDEARNAELQKQQDNETIESYCARAERQGFLKTKWDVDTIAQCIDKLKARERLGKRIIEQARDNAAKKRKALEDALKKRCLEAISNNRPIPASCKGIANSNGSGSGTVTTGTTVR